MLVEAQVLGLKAAVNSRGLSSLTLFLMQLLVLLNGHGTRYQPGQPSRPCQARAVFVSLFLGSWKELF